MESKAVATLVFQTQRSLFVPPPSPSQTNLIPSKFPSPPSPQYSPAWPWCSVLCATTKTTTSTTRSQAATHSEPLPRPLTTTLHMLLFGSWSLPILSKLSELSGESANLGWGSTTFWQVRSTLLRKSPFSGTSFRNSSVWIFGGKIELSFIFAFSGLLTISCQKMWPSTSRHHKRSWIKDEDVHSFLFGASILFIFFRVAILYLWAENELAHLQLGNESKLTKESCYKIWGHAKRLSQNWSLTILLEQLTLKIDIFDQHISCAFPALG